jgi:hypothetical protein
VRWVWFKQGVYAAFFEMSVEFQRTTDRYMPVTVAERSKACTVFARSEAGTVASNPTQGMDV